MIRNMVVSCLLLFTATAAVADTQVRVRLFEKYTSFVITGQIQIFKDKLYLGQKLLLNVTPPKISWVLENEGQKVLDDVSFSDLIVEGRNLFYNGLKLPQRLKILPVWQVGKFSRYQILGLLELEDYLAGVLPVEMPMAWPVEALKAQAITARTYTLKQIDQRKNENYDVDSTVRDQLFVYDVAMTDAKRKNLQEALGETRGVVLRDSKGQLLAANYHSDCGGQTEVSHDVWSDGRKGVTVSDRSCAFRPRGEWTLRVSVSDLLRKIQTEFASQTLPRKLIQVDNVGHTSGGRVSQVRLAFAGGEMVMLPATKLRELLGYSDMRSTRFEARLFNDAVEFRGRGFGHGVGLCQWGAKDLARSGKSFESILAHYFPGGQLRPMSSTAVVTR